MAPFDFLPARRLRRGPTLLLPAPVAPARLLETVRLHSPEAVRQGRSVRIGDAVRLRGPYTAGRAPVLAARTPARGPVAYLADLLDPESEITPAAIVAGLAERLGGRCLSAHREPSPDLFSVTGRALETSRLAGLLPGARPVTIPGTDVMLLTGGEGPLEISFCGGHDGEMDYEVSVTRGPITPEVVRAAGELALSIGAASAGTVRDRNGFLLPVPVPAGG